MNIRIEGTIVDAIDYIKNNSQLDDNDIVVTPNGFVSVGEYRKNIEYHRHILSVFGDMLLNNSKNIGEFGEILNSNFKEIVKEEVNPDTKDEHKSKDNEVDDTL